MKKPNYEILTSFIIDLTTDRKKNLNLILQENWTKKLLIAAQALCLISPANIVVMLHPRGQ